MSNEQENEPEKERKEAKAGGKAVERDRNVYISAKALVRTFDDKGEIVREELVPRNTYTLTLHLKEYDPESVVGIYLVEDEERSDPPSEGKPRYAMPLFPSETDKDGNAVGSERMKVVDAIGRLAAATTPDKIVLAKLHQHCDHASATSHYDCGMYTMVFQGKPCGFAYLNSCRDVPVESLSLLYETAKAQVESLKDQLRKIAPSIRFSDDPDPDPDPVEVPGRPGLVLPSGMPADSAGGPIVTPEQAAREAEARGLTRIVQIVD